MDLISGFMLMPHNINRGREGEKMGGKRREGVVGRVRTGDRGLIESVQVLMS